MKKEKPIAILTVYGISELDKRKVERICEWLQRQGKEIIENRKEFARRYTARIF